jgi:hypothetical protein
MGIDHVTAAIVKRESGIKISSVAYATEESASDESTERAFHFGSFSWIAI